MKYTPNKFISNKCYDIVFNVSEICLVSVSHNIFNSVYSHFSSKFIYSFSGRSFYQLWKKSLYVCTLVYSEPYTNTKNEQKPLLIANEAKNVWEDTKIILIDTKFIIISK